MSDDRCQARAYAEAVAVAERDFYCEHGHGGCAAFQDGGACMDELLTSCGCSECRGDRGEPTDDGPAEKPEDETEPRPACYACGRPIREDESSVEHGGRERHSDCDEASK